MDTISLLESRTIVMRGLLTVGPHGPSTFIKSKASVSLSKTVKLVRLQFEIDLGVSVHHPESLASSGDEGFVGVSRSDGKVERIHVE
jgi:hypothetical protein